MFKVIMGLIRILNLYLEPRRFGQWFDINKTYSAIVLTHLLINPVVVDGDNSDWIGVT